MELTHRFTVPAGLAETWAAFNDLEGVAGCFPGATVTEVDGDDFKGTCKVKLGPIALTYTGAGRFVEKDEAAGRFVIEAKGKDKRGNGTAGATVTAALSDAGGSTDIEVVTDLAITGKPAQFGRGVIQDVSDKLLGQFVGCLEERLGSGGGDPASEEAAPAANGYAEGESPAARAGPATQEPAAPEAPTPPRPSPMPPREQPRQDDALDLGATVLPVLARAYWKPAAALLAVVLVIWWWASRS